jgi:hypothetical protein
MTRGLFGPRGSISDPRRDGAQFTLKKMPQSTEFGSLARFILRLVIDKTGSMLRKYMKNKAMKFGAPSATLLRKH